MVAQQSKVMVMGANGRLGRVLVEAFANEGWQVKAQMRDESRWVGRSWPAGVIPCFCDAYDEAALCRAAQGEDVVVNALNPPYTEWEHNAMILAGNAISAARTSGATLLFPGNIYNFGRELPECLREATQQVANTPKARIRIEMESALRDAAAMGVDTIVLRTGDYFGAEARGSWLDKVITKALPKGRVLYPGPFDVKHAWTYLPDFAMAFTRIAARRAEMGGYREYLFPGYSITGAELHQALERVTERKLKLKRMPWWILQLVSPFSPMARSLLEMRYLWERPHQLEDGPLSECIGELPATPLDDALRATLTGLGMMHTTEQ